jgi:hypothetical protein
VDPLDLPPTDAPDVEGHRLAANDDETVVTDPPAEPDVEGHRLASNDNETVVADD